MTKQKRLARMEIARRITQPQGPFWWRLVGSNGQIICVSETFKRRADAKRAMRRAIQIIQSGLFKVEE